MQVYRQKKIFLLFFASNKITENTPRNILYGQSFRINYFSTTKITFKNISQHSFFNIRLLHHQKLVILRRFGTTKPKQVVWMLEMRLEKKQMQNEVNVLQKPCNLFVKGREEC